MDQRSPVNKSGERDCISDGGMRGPGSVYVPVRGEGGSGFTLAPIWFLFACLFVFSSVFIVCFLFCFFHFAFFTFIFNFCGSSQYHNIAQCQNNSWIK